MISIMKQIDLLASTDATVRITGETGTGIDNIARIIHSSSVWHKHMFVKVNCATLSYQLL